FAGGVVVAGAGSAARGRANAVAVQPDGKIVVVGTEMGDSSQIAVLRFHPDGRPDEGFGAAGRVLVGPPGSSAWAEGNGVALQPDGKIVVAGAALMSTVARMAVIRLLPTGELDTDFAGGMVAVGAGVTGWSGGNAVGLQSDGKIVVAGTGAPVDQVENEEFMVARLLPNGTMDGGFGTGGVTLTAFGDSLAEERAHALSVLPDGKLLVGGQTSAAVHASPTPGTWYNALARYTSGGILDPSFGTNGLVTSDVSPASDPTSGLIYALAVQADGRIVAGGRSDPPHTPGRMAVTRYLPDGRLDPTFGAGGVVLPPTVPSVRWASSVVVTPTGRVVLGGPSFPGPSFALADMALVALTPNGALDSSFGRGGLASIDVAGADDYLAAMAMQPDGRIVGVGLTGTGTAERMVVARFRPLSATSTVAAWGFNGKGQLGVDSLADRHTPAAVPGLTRTNVVAAGAYHTLSVRDDGTVDGWGFNGTGAVGDGTTVDRDTPVDVSGLADVTTVAAGYYHSLAVRGGKVWAWGWNGFGQLGDGTTVDRRVPVEVPGLSGIVAVSGGAFHSLALKNDGTVWAWGWNYFGQLGDDTTTDRHLPVQVPGIFDATIIAAGGFHSLAASATGGSGTWAWGFNHFGQLGIADSRADRHSPALEGSFAPPVALAAGAYHTLGLFEDGVVRSWGFNGFGQQGDGTTVESGAWEEVSGLTNVSSIAAGIFHSVAVDEAGKVWSWGWNYFGQLGDGSTVDRHVPVPAPALTGATTVAAGAFHTVVPRVAP
ncbi:MAG TPA: hypothetical protein VJ653_00495, partial [Acidimicrobiales bacterium]|nr:hypothetical protein [Acidimicrobiales bacterium]